MVRAVDGNDIVVLDAKTTAFGGVPTRKTAGKLQAVVPTKGKPGLFGCALPLDGYAKSPAEHAALDGTPIPHMGFGVLSNCGDNPNGAHVVVTDRATGGMLRYLLLILDPRKRQAMLWI